MERLIAWWVHNPVAANLLMVGILLAGLLGFQTMEREAFPLFKSNQVVVQATWPGAAPQEVEEQVILRFEQALKEVENVYRIYATASENQARLEVLTYADVDLNAFLDDVSNAIGSVTGLPRDLENIKVQRDVRRDEMARVVVHSSVLTERQLLRLAEDLRKEIAALPFVSLVDLFGSDVKKSPLSCQNVAYDNLVCVLTTLLALSAQALLTCRQAKFAPPTATLDYERETWLITNRTLAR